MSAEDHVKKGCLRIQPRYYRWTVAPELEWTEANTGHAHVDWEIPLDQAGLVLLDVWDSHYLKETKARAEQIIRERLAPAVRTLRSHGMQIIHGPSPKLAVQSQQWFGRNLDPAEVAAGEKSDWPPPQFRQKTGPYAKYAELAEPTRDQQLEQLGDRRKIHPAVAPESPDVVIADGEELHEFCRRKGLLFLFYAGFNTNACIIHRDYGMLEMNKRGYATVLLRDCTTGLEAHHTQSALQQTNAAILLLEMFRHYTITAQNLLAGLNAVST